jgi:hypothetical protein
MALTTLPCATVLACDVICHAAQHQKQKQTKTENVSNSSEKTSIASPHSCEYNAFVVLLSGTLHSLRRINFAYVYKQAISRVPVCCYVQYIDERSAYSSLYHCYCYVKIPVSMRFAPKICNQISLYNRPAPFLQAYKKGSKTLYFSH